jgi:hypothetical protein
MNTQKYTEIATRFLATLEGVGSNYEDIERKALDFFAEKRAKNFPEDLTVRSENEAGPAFLMDFRMGVTGALKSLVEEKDATIRATILMSVINATSAFQDEVVKISDILTKIKEASDAGSFDVVFKLLNESFIKNLTDNGAGEKCLSNLLVQTDEATYAIDGLIVKVWDACVTQAKKQGFGEVYKDVLTRLYGKCSEILGDELFESPAMKEIVKEASVRDKKGHDVLSHMKITTDKQLQIANSLIESGASPYLKNGKSLLSVLNWGKYNSLYTKKLEVLTTDYDQRMERVKLEDCLGSGGGAGNATETKAKGPKPS